MDEPIKHEFKKDSSGEIDFFVHQYGTHNGPGCVRCKESFCEHCDPERMNEPCHNQDPVLFGDQ